MSLLQEILGFVKKKVYTFIQDDDYFILARKERPKLYISFKPDMAAGLIKFKDYKNSLGYTEPELIIGTPGGVTNYTSEKNFVYLKYSGGNGIHTLYLPLAANSKNRSIRFICDDSLTANHEIYITPSGSDTIDGSASPRQVDRNYEGLTLWSDGTEWIVIQAKAH